MDKEEWFTMGILFGVLLLIAGFLAWGFHWTGWFLGCAIVAILGIFGTVALWIEKDERGGFNVWTGLVTSIAIFVVVAGSVGAYHSVKNDTAIDDGETVTVTRTVTQTVTVSSTSSSSTSPTPTSGSGTVTVSRSGSWTYLNATGKAEWTISVAEKDRQFVFIHDCGDPDKSHFQYADGNPRMTAKCVVLENRNNNYDIPAAWSWKLT